MSETPASESPERPGEPSPPLVSPPLGPKRGAIPTPRWEIEAAEPYVPEPDHEPDHDHDALEDLRRPQPEDLAAPE